MIPLQSLLRLLTPWIWIVSALVAGYYIALGLLVGILHIEAVRNRLRKYGELKETIGSAFMYLTFACAIAVGIVIKNVAYADSEVRMRVISGTVVVCAVAGGLFALKIKALRVYAVLELSFAVAVVGQTLNSLGEEILPLQALGLMTGAYLVIRGLDNFKKDLDERKKRAAEPPKSA